MQKDNANYIKKLKKQRRHNTQEQMALMSERLRQEALHWRKNGLPGPLQQVMQARGIDLHQSIFFDYDQNLPGMETDVGIILTAAGKFYRFEVNLNAERTELVELSLFKDVSNQFALVNNQKGIPKTLGQLALDILKDLNQKIT